MRHGTFGTVSATLAAAWSADPGRATADAMRRGVARIFEASFRAGDIFVAVYDDTGALIEPEQVVMPDRWSPPEDAEVVDSSELRPLLAGTSAAPLVESGNERMFGSVRSIAMSKLAALPVILAMAI